MKRTAVIIFSILFGMSQSFAQNDKDFITTPSGLKYKITQKAKDKKAPQPKKEDLVKVHYTGKLTNDTVFDSSVQRNEPIKFQLGVGQVIPGWDEGIALLKKGEKATFIIPANLGYGDRQVGPIPANSTLVFDVELIDIIEKVTPVPFEVKGKDTLTTATGLQYIMVKKNDKGVAAKPGQTVKVHYSGYLTDGKMFDSSVARGEAFEFPVGQKRVIAGWDEAFSLLKTGEKARLVIPYNLAYGEQGYPGVIPPKATLVFDVELLEVK